MRLSRGICALLSAAFLLSACAAIAPAQDRDLIFGFTPVLSEAEMRLGSTLSSTEPIPHDAVAVRVGMDEAQVKKIQTGLVDLEKTPAGQAVIANSKKKLTGHVIANDGLFDIVRRTATIAGL